MDPVSIGATAAILLATKLGEELARNAGASTWDAVKRLRELTLAKFRDNAPRRGAIEILVEAPTEENLTIAAEIVDEAVRIDPEFASAVSELVEQARNSPQLTTFSAQAYDEAKQVNVAGDNFGPVTLS